MDRSVGRNEDKGGRPRSGDSELSFRGIIHVVCQANGRAGKLAGPRNIAFSSVSSKKRGNRHACVCVYVCCFFFYSLPLPPSLWICTWQPRHILGATLAVIVTASIFLSFPLRVFTRASLFEHLFWPVRRSRNENAVYICIVRDSAGSLVRDRKKKKGRCGAAYHQCREKSIDECRG